MYSSDLNFGWKTVHTFDKLSGCFVTHPRPLTWKNYLIRFLFYIIIVIIDFLVISTLFLHYKDLPSFILSSCTCMALVTGDWTLFKLTMDTESFLILVNRMQDLEISYGNAFDSAKKIYINFLKIYNLTTWLVGFGGVIVNVLIGCLFPGVLFPKFKPPVPFYLPVGNQDTWTIFLIASMIQIAGFYAANCILSLAVSFLIIYYCDVSTYFHIIMTKINSLHAFIHTKYDKSTNICPSERRMKVKTADLCKKIEIIVNMITDANK